MNMRKSLAASVLLVAGLAAGAAGAAELTLYGRPNFGGAELTLHKNTRNVGEYNFNDRTSSVVVRSGRWQVCTDADFRGHCAELVPGEYPRLDAAFDNGISSAREIGSDVRGRDRYGRDGLIKFFSQTGFRGRSLDLQRNVEDFTTRGYNDRASSIMVTEGVWELCTDAGYAGECRRYGPGRYADLGSGTGRISSAHVVHDTDRGPAERRGDWRHGPGRYGDVSRITLFAQEKLQGQRFDTSEAVANLQEHRFNDVADSARVEGGPWLVCTDAHFRGHCRVLEPGYHVNLRELGLAESISSVRRAEPQAIGRSR